MDWYPWGEEAFRRAAAEDKPVFLSIGYSTCHWCHVMARESFQNERIAALLNTGFIAIKVDREERPDIDSVYMDACVQMTGQGGWPLTVIMTAEKKPFFAGTYFPPENRAGMNGLDTILRQITRLWNTHRGDLLDAAGHLTGVLAATTHQTLPGSADEAVLHSGYSALAARFDPVAGGFGSAPKFPSPATVLFLLRYWKRTGSGPALSMAEKTLRELSHGGIRDHLDGGFHRYSTDRWWRIPHFEKMLYDQALLIMAFTEAWLATKDQLYRSTAEECIAYVFRSMSLPDGACIAAVDADSSGGEGAYYLWTLAELREVLGEETGLYAAERFGVTENGNFSAAGPGQNVLFTRPDPGGAGENHSRPGTISRQLLAYRDKRPPPGKDEKVLTGWNALMAAALCTASRAFSRPDCAERAAGVIHFVLARMRMPDGGIFHRWFAGEASVPGFAEDYACLISALIGLYETTFDPDWLSAAIAFDQYLSLHFSDPRGSGFFTIADTGEPLIVRKKEFADAVIPSANALMLCNLVSLGHLTGNPAYEQRASALADAFAGTAERFPSSSCMYLCGLDLLFGPVTDVVIAGEESDPGAGAMLTLARTSYLPSSLILFRSGAAAAALDHIAPFTRDLIARDGSATAYVCTGRSCSAPVTAPEELRGLLGIEKQ